ncbi:regulatory protein RecX [Candidatus Spongiihabitans sp.]|uniref:regulatory protein RecX n=1 Tax=Candidatus Spongiihabitans sp. TaxID=3101308 RepID=UPI003C7B018F
MNQNNYSDNYSESSQSQTDELIRLLKDQACRLLARREYSAFELRQKFAQLVPPPIRAQILDDLLDNMLDDLMRRGMQSDARFAEMLCRSRFNGGKGPVRLKHELNKHNINPDLIERAMAVYQGQWAASAAQVRRRKFGDHAPASYAEWARQARFLQQRGFTAEQIESYGE